MTKKTQKKTIINFEINSLLATGQKPFGQCLIHAWGVVRGTPTREVMFVGVSGGMGGAKPRGGHR